MLELSMIAPPAIVFIAMISGTFVKAFATILAKQTTIVFRVVVTVDHAITKSVSVIPFLRRFARTRNSLLLSVPLISTSSLSR